MLSQEPIRFEDLPKEKQEAVKKLVRSYMFRNVLTSLNYGALMVFSNIALVLADYVYLHSLLLVFLLSIVLNISLLRMMSNQVAINTNFVQTEIKKILNQ